MKEHRAPFNLIMKLEHDSTRAGLWMASGTLLASIFFGKMSGLFGPFFLKVIGFLFFLAFAPLSLLIIHYLARLHFTQRNRLEFNEDGLYDFASPCELGHVPMKSICHIGFAQLLGYDFLRVTFYNSMNPLRKKRGFVVAVYRQLFGLELWVPVGLFRISRVDLESQLIHLDRLLDGKPKSESYETRESKTPPPVPSKRAGSGFVSRAATSDEKAPPLTQDRADKNKILDQVKAIKEQVRSTGFDKRIANFYLDHISRFSNLKKNGNLPVQIENLVSKNQGADYEEVQFRFMGQSFSFGLRRDIGASDEALLSVGVDGPVHCSLKVRVEIGELMPIELESFIPGVWQLNIEQLMKLIEEMNAIQLDLTKRIDPVEVTKTNLADLKNRFGIKE